MTEGPLAAEAAGLLEPLGSRRAGERVAERLITAIALGQYLPGQRLPSERRLAELLQVSRVTVRDALHRLVKEGHVEIRRGRNGGAFVRTASSPNAAAMIRRTLVSSWSRLAQLLDFRCGVECQIARLAAERRTEEDRVRIGRLSEAYLRSGDTREQSQLADYALHEAIAWAAHNRLWLDLSVELRFEVNQGLGTEPFNAELRHLALQQHPLLAEAVIDGNVERAGEIAAGHFALNADAIRQLLAQVSRDAGGGAASGSDAPAERSVADETGRTA